MQRFAGDFPFFLLRHAGVRLFLGVFIHARATTERMRADVGAMSRRVWECCLRGIFCHGAGGWVGGGGLLKACASANDFLFGSYIWGGGGGLLKACASANDFLFGSYIMVLPARRRWRLRQSVHA
ncbi:hypothetical protein [Oligosphaera ethanolica]|uniref:Uncharacterized protein n=1 Tax=Oligosphaera ethanolica TaxID=760260 RepID=A0AAE4APD0_9BACT|nr:hypothetical protein [Oligosphaera ethanolica]MDQ0290395.1 hypothetical protein [Oligosphaera ethanolica]